MSDVAVSSPAADVRPFVSQGLRWLVMACALIVLGLRYPGLADIWLVAIVALAGLTVDVHSPIALRNYFLLYALVFFLVGNQLFYADEKNLNFDLFAYLAFFLIGYQLHKLPRRHLQTTSGEERHTAPRLAEPFAPEVPARTERLLWALGAIQVLRLLGFIASYGLLNFYSGKELVSRFQAYSESGATTQATVNILLTVSVSAVAALYCESSIRTRRRINYRLLFLVLLVVPALSLQRSVLVYHSILLVAIHGCDKRFGAGREATRRAPGNRRRILPAALILLGVAGVAIKVGEIRSKEFNRQTNQVAGDDVLSQVLRSEFTPIVFYRDVKANIDELGYRYGTPIVGALATRFVPRAFWPGKPVTTQEFYMRQLYPGQLARGFSLAPSVFGVGYLNFGLLGCAVLMALLGFLAARYDEAYVEGNLARLAPFLIVSSWAYSLLRDDLSTSLASVLATFIVYRLVRAAVATRHYRAQDSGPTDESASSSVPGTGSAGAAAPSAP